jgi:branched-chain amino acid transport system ATP-binding protein
VNTAPLLSVEDLSMRFGGLVAVDQVSFQIGHGEIAALIGPNGAGKTTVFNCITGFYRPTAGRIALAPAGAPPLAIETVPGYRIARSGVARTFQNIRHFPHLTALENLRVARPTALVGTGFLSAAAFSVAGLLRLPSYRRSEAEAVVRAREWLERVNLLDAADREAGTLPYGAQRRLEIARAMCTEPVLLCLDEPAAGLNAVETGNLASLLREIRETCRIGILLIEHDMHMVMGISDHVIVLDHGRTIADGTPQSVRSNPHVIRAYLGEEEVEPLPAEVASDLGGSEGRQ